LLDFLPDKSAVSQQDLTDAITTLNLNPPELGFSTWLDTWKTRQEALMPPAYTIQVILENDVEKVFMEAQKSENKLSLEAQKFVVSVRINNQKTKQWKKNPAFKFYPIAPTEDIHYHPEIGAYLPTDKFLTNTYGHKTNID
jgi:CRISPR-associated endonuclease/helicase Cas3